MIIYSVPEWNGSNDATAAGDVDAVRGDAVAANRDAKVRCGAVGPTTTPQDATGVDPQNAVNELISVLTAIASVTPSVSIGGRSVVGILILIKRPFPDIPRHIAEPLLGVP